MAKKVPSFDWSSGNEYLLISVSVFKSKITKADGAICFGFPKISANPVSITHKRSHSSTRILNVEIIVALSAKASCDSSALLACKRSTASPVVGAATTPGNVFACQLGYGERTGDLTFSDNLI